jgi:hypothetical protein
VERYVVRSNRGQNEQSFAYRHRSQDPLVKITAVRWLALLARRGRYDCPWSIAGSALWASSRRVRASRFLAARHSETFHDPAPVGT